MSDVVPGQRIDDFEILGIAGRGGMGVVYRARQVSLDRVVAFKLIAAEITSDPDHLARFAREVRVAAAVEHPNVVSVHGAGRLDGRPYLAMQWVDGTDLRTLIDEHGPLEPERACAIAGQLASALDAIHERGLLHRDLKPANVLLRRVKRRDHVYLTDFGIAKFLQQETNPLTKTGYIVGTPGYIAPECIRGEDGDDRADVYALGCVMFECLAGERSFTASNEIAMFWAHANNERPALSERRPHLGDRFDAVLQKAMAIAPHERYESGTEFADALQAALHSGARPVPVPGAPVPGPTVSGVGAPASPAHPPPTVPRAEDPTPPPPPAPPPAPAPAPAPATVPADPAPRGPSAGSPAPPPPPERRGVSPATAGILGLVALAAVAGVLFATGVFSGSDGGDGSGGVGSSAEATEDVPGGLTAAERVTARADVVSALRRYEQAYTRQDDRGLRALFTPDVTRHGLRSGGCSETSGRADVVDTYREQFRQGTGSYVLTTLATRNVQLEGRDRASVTSRYAIRPGGTGSVTFDLARRAEGWRITRVDANC